MIYHYPLPPKFKIFANFIVIMSGYYHNLVLERVKYSDWATPVVPVPKPDGTV